MHAFIKDVVDKSIPLLIVVSPKYGTSGSEVLQPIKVICTEYDIPFVDYFSDKEFMSHKEWFKEPMHLNEEGSREYTSRLVENINLIYN